MRFKRTISYLPALLVAEIVRRRALNAAGIPGHSQRAIGRELAVDPETVRAIDRGAYASEPVECRRCGVCGYKVLHPCRICAARQEKLEPSLAAA